MKLYPGARHELLNELNREEVMNDILTWINEKLSRWDEVLHTIKTACEPCSQAVLLIWKEKPETSVNREFPGGAGNVTRTHDLLITNQLLYRLSYASKNTVN